MMLAPAPRCLAAAWVMSEEAEDVDVELAVEGIFGDGFEWREFVHAGIIDENVEAAVIFDGCRDDALGFGGFGNVATYGNGFAAGCGDGLRLYRRRLCWKRSLRRPMRLRRLGPGRWLRRYLWKRRLRLRLYLLACSLVTPLDVVGVWILLPYEMRVDARGIL